MQTIEPPVDLTEIAKRSMIEHRLLPEFPPQVMKEVDHLQAVTKPISNATKDLRHFQWFSLDNDDSRDLDQLTFAENLISHFKIYIAIADVDSMVNQGSYTDQFAQNNTTSVYTPTKVFPMLPEKLSTNLTSLNENQDRLAIIVEVDVQLNGDLGNFAIYPGLVHNYAKLAYNSVSAWLDGMGAPPKPVKQNLELVQQVRLQDEIAKSLRKYRHQQGALTLQTIEPHVVMQNHKIVEIVPTVRNRGRDLIEDFMIAANRSTALYLHACRIPSLRRVVRIPKRWDRIVTIASELGETLPSEPDAKALDDFLIARFLQDPLHFPDLSLTIIKLLGNGEYVVEYPGEESIGHFGLAVKNYTHATAPNRRYCDLITQRLIKSAIGNQPLSYVSSELEKLARHCTEKENDADKVERKMKKSVSCILLSSKVNEEFDALVTGATPKGTWVRILQPPTEGKLIRGFENVDVGDQIRVKLVSVNIEKGFIDFIRI